MAVQEAVEQLERLPDSHDADEDSDVPLSNNKGEYRSVAGKPKLNSPITQLTILIDLYGSCKCSDLFGGCMLLDAEKVAKQSRGCNCAESLPQTHLGRY
jgi:hypothetical protein